MLTLTQVDRIAADAAMKALNAGSFLRTLAEETTDSDGQDAVLVTVIINDLRNAPVSGDTALDMIVSVKHQLERAGEDRRVIINFATEDDITADGGA